MSIFSKLFGGGGSAPGPEPEEHNGFRIFPEPQSDAGGFRIAGRIEKEIGGEVKVHRFLRADTIQSKEEAQRFTVLKARQIIDEQGERIFG
ncbi:HlyU family transcriptional regulator [Roseibacterium sp. SDUM158016]|uniref:HlyU family transcriptional regulator n=1 Tax=Roseicyclus sediminis TaxID=2980997 RepID=UPI0021CF70D1|nr:HlyU family transcriptional regulator [Roseibacterium sp. SDUM158016]MCU4653196.1 HlyU family transcriptional regulator [Roseibacterium sp. SDUM158016]